MPTINPVNQPPFPAFGCASSGELKWKLCNIPVLYCTHFNLLLEETRIRLRVHFLDSSLGKQRRIFPKQTLACVI